MKILTIQQPWAWAISEEFKDVENRVWTTNYRGQIGIHAGTSKQSMKMLRHVKELTNCDKPDLVFGAIIAVVDLVDIVQDSSSQWAMPNQYHWILSNPIKIDPIFVKGQLGLWNYDVKIKELLGVN